MFSFLSRINLTTGDVKDNGYGRYKGLSLDGNKKGRSNLPFLYALSEELFLSVFHVVLVTVHELVNTSCRVNQFNLTGIERV